MKLVEKIFGTHSSREVKRILPLVDRIEELRPAMQALSDSQLRDKTREFKERLADGGATLDDHSPGGVCDGERGGQSVFLNMEHYRYS
jgi:preprotein translocase subunit SecA